MSGSRPCVGRQRLRDHELARREVQADAVLERRVRLVVEVDARCRASPISSRELVAGRSPNAACTRSSSAFGRARKRSRCVGRAADEQDRRPAAAARAPGAKSAVGDRQRQRAPDGHVRVGGRHDQRVEGDEPVDVAGVHAATARRGGAEVRVRAVAARARDRLGQEAEHRRRAGRRRRRGGRTSGRNDDHDVRARRPATCASIASASAPARNSTKRVRTRADCSSSAQASKNVACPTNASRSARADPRDRIRAAAPAHDRARRHRRAHARGRRRQGSPHGG